MKLNDKAAAALKQPDTLSLSVEMTPERRERYHRIAALIIDILKANTQGPVEAYGILHFMMDAFEESHGIRGVVVMEHGDPQQS
jgi:hypothetical protein